MTQTSESRTSSLSSDLKRCALLQLLANSLVLTQTAPYLSCQDVLNLAATSRAFRFLVYRTPHVFRRLDLENVKKAQENLTVGWTDGVESQYATAEDYYSRPLRNIFAALQRLDILRDVQILSLDGLSVTAELVHDILNDPAFNVRILSIRDVKNLNEHKLRAALQYACRPSRPEGMPRLKGLYYFGARDPKPKSLSSSPDSSASSSSTRSPASLSSTTTNHSSPWPLHHALSLTLSSDLEPWWQRRGRQLPQSQISPEWADTLRACTGIIAFDAVLCTGPRHLNSPAWGTIDMEALNAAAANPNATMVKPFAVASYSLGPCEGCGAAPEGLITWGDEDWCLGGERDEFGRRLSESSSCGERDLAGRYPLLTPVPMHSASLRGAMCPEGEVLRPSLMGKKGKRKMFVPRCWDCIRERYCAGCHKWWCEQCWVGPMNAGSVGMPHVQRSCWECGMNCKDCIADTQRTCQICGGGYCLIHNEGSDLAACDWCAGWSRRRFDRDLY